MKVESIEVCSSDNTTVSMLFVNGVHRHFIIEDGYRPTKIAGETRIPAGNYRIEPRFHGKFFEKYHNKYGHEFALEIVGIEDFTDVLFHIGNTRLDTRGCNLNNMGFAIDKASRDYIGIDSTTAYKEFYDLVAPEIKKGNVVTYIVVRNKVNAPT